MDERYRMLMNSQIIKNEFAKDCFLDVQPVCGRILGSTIKVYIIHRSDIEAIFKKYGDLLTGPCVYCLFSYQPTNGKTDIYIGETTNWLERWKKGHREKDYWDYLCLAIDVDLHRTIIRRVEWELVQHLRKNSNLNVHTRLVSKEIVPDYQMSYVDDFISRFKVISSDIDPTLRYVFRDLDNSDPEDGGVTLYESLKRPDIMVLKSCVTRDLTKYFDIDDLDGRTFSMSEVYFGYDPTVIKFAFTILPGSTIFNFSTQWIKDKGRANERGKNIARCVVDDPNDPYKYLVVENIICPTAGQASLFGRADQQHGKDWVDLESGEYLLTLTNEYKSNRNGILGKKIKEIAEYKLNNGDIFHF